MIGKIRWLFGSSFGLITLLSLVLFYRTKQNPWVFMAGILFALVLLGDLLSGSDRLNVPPDEEKKKTEDVFYLIALILPVPIIFGIVFYSASIFRNMEMAICERIALLLTLAITAVSALNLGHELCHRHRALEQWLGRLCCGLGFYGHFPIAHNYYHHNMVATPEDPSTARLGESFYRFLGRQIAGNFYHAWRIEKRRLAGKAWWHNQIVQNAMITALIYGGIIMVGGMKGAAYVIGSLIIGAYVFFALAEYLEHYGLLRDKKENGEYEPCQPKHSWNANAIFSNLYLFNLERHSDHHAFPSRPYQVLRHFDESPQLPTGYLGMMFLALVPPLWFRIMHPRLRQNQGHYPENYCSRKGAIIRQP